MAQKESAAKAARPRRILPTARIGFPRQLDILRAWAAASGPGKKPVGLKDTAALVKMAENTITLANPFYTDVGLLIRVDGGFVPSDEVLSFNHAFQWNPETASQKLAPIIERAWFSEALMPGLAFGPLTVADAVATLSEAAGASKEYEDQLQSLLDYMQAAGLVAMENGTVQRVAASARGPAAPSAAPPPAVASNNDAASRFASPVSTAFSKPTEGMINFHVSFRVDMMEMSGWSADRITAFFGGIAQVLSAKGDIEESAASV